MCEVLIHGCKLAQMRKIAGRYTSEDCDASSDCYENSDCDENFDSSSAAAHNCITGAHWYGCWLEVRCWEVRYHRGYFHDCENARVGEVGGVRRCCPELRSDDLKSL